VVSVETFVNPAPSPTNKPNDAVEVIEPVISLTNVSFPNDDVESLFRYEALSASIVCKSEPLAKLPVSSNVT
jgi:hypothetical protein